MKKILVVGQTPPPYGGQANMIKYMVDGVYNNIELYHIRTCFSRSFLERGRFSFHKIFHMFEIVLKIWIFKAKHRDVNVLYYPLSCAPKIAVYRDAFILCMTRFLFKKIIYHLHAVGISEELPKYNKIPRAIIYQIIQKPSLTITSSKYNPKDGEYLKSDDIKIVPLGIPDENANEERKLIGQKSYLTVLHMGLLNESKGEGDVLEAVKILNEVGCDVRYILAGQFESSEYEHDFMERVRTYGLENKFEYRGVVVGEAKKKAFMDADIVCFPSFFHSESFGVVLLEGMMYQMPLIASRRRGLISVVSENENGYLVDVHDAKQIATSIKMLYDDRGLLQLMSQKSREIFKREYELSKYLSNMELALIKV